jgi:hypothetical protein
MNILKSRKRFETQKVDLNNEINLNLNPNNNNNNNNNNSNFVDIEKESASCLFPNEKKLKDDSIIDHDTITTLNGGNVKEKFAKFLIGQRKNKRTTSESSSNDGSVKEENNVEFDRTKSERSSGRSKRNVLFSSSRSISNEPSNTIKTGIF